MVMNIDAVVAVLTTVLSVGVKVIGMPDQIKANRQRKSTEGLSWWFMICTLVSYAMWVVHGVLVHDMSLIIGQSLGVLVSAVIVGQMLAYRKNTNAFTAAEKPVVLWHWAKFKQVPRRVKTIVVKAPVQDKINTSYPN